MSSGTDVQPAPTVNAVLYERELDEDEIRDADAALDDTWSRLGFEFVALDIGSPQDWPANVELDEALNEFGAPGWELVSAFDDDGPLAHVLN